MKTLDVGIIETGNGGELQLTKNDLVTVEDIENEPYLAMFGGNEEDVTKDNVTNEQNFDWWANKLLMLGDSVIQMNSTVQKTLNNTALTSAGAKEIEKSILVDLKYLATRATISVVVTIVSTDRIDVELSVKSLSTGKQTITVIQFKKMSVGDWFIADFNSSDFLI